MTVSLTTGKAAIIALIANVSSTGKAFDQLVWDAAASVVMHKSTCHDATLANDLVKALPKGSRGNALIEYFVTTAAVTFDEKSKTLKNNPNAEYKTDLAQSKSWVEYKPEQPYRGFDFKAQIAALIAKADLAAQEDQPERMKLVLLNGADLDAMKELASKLGIELKAPKAAKVKQVAPIEADADLPEDVAAVG